MPTLQIPINFTISGDIFDANTDLLKVEIPNINNFILTKVSVNSLIAATGTPSIAVQTAAAAAGTGCTVTFVDSETFASNTCTISNFTTYGWIRSVTTGDLSGLNVTLRYRYA